MNRKKHQRTWPFKSNIRRWMPMLGVSVLILLAAVGFDAALGAKAWEIDGVNDDLRQQVDSVLRDMPGGFLAMRPARVCEHLLAEVPDIAVCQARRQLPDRLMLQLEPALPVAMWERKEGLLLIDQRGRAYRPMARADNLDLPLLRLTSADVREAVGILHALKERGGEWMSQLSECIATDSSWKLIFSGRQYWLLPKSDAAPGRALELTATLGRERWQSGHWQVDARLDTRWFIRQARGREVI